MTLRDEIEKILMTYAKDDDFDEWVDLILSAVRRRVPKEKNICWGKGIYEEYYEGRGFNQCREEILKEVE